MQLLNARKDYDNKVYLSSKLKPLRKAFGGSQLPLPGMNEPDEMCGGHCWV